MPVKPLDTIHQPTVPWMPISIPMRSNLNDQDLLDENSDLVTQAILNELFYRDLLQKEESDSEDELYS